MATKLKKSKLYQTGWKVCAACLLFIMALVIFFCGVVFSSVTKDWGRSILTEEGKRQTFELILHPEGTEFQKAAWQALMEIPYGETRTYKQQAESIGKPKALRAIGMANHRNPIPIFIPCHRVIGADGSLTGYGGGLQIKRTLLDLERRTLEKQRETELRKAAQ